MHRQEHVRFPVPHSWLASYIQLIKNYVPKIPAQLIFKIDETGQSVWEERKEKMLLIPSAQVGSTLHSPVNRSIKHHPLTCCISAAGDAYCPLLITPNREAQTLLKQASAGTTIL
jgi:hypothetical protein